MGSKNAVWLVALGLIMGVGAGIVGVAALDDDAEPQLQEAPIVVVDNDPDGPSSQPNMRQSSSSGSAPAAPAYQPSNGPVFVQMDGSGTDPRPDDGEETHVRRGTDESEMPESPADTGAGSSSTDGGAGSSGDSSSGSTRHYPDVAAEYCSSHDCTGP